MRDTVVDADTPVLHSAVDPGDAGFARNARRTGRWSPTCARSSRRPGSGGPERARARHVDARQAAARASGSTRCSTRAVAVPRAVAAGRARAVRRRGARRPGSSPASAGSRGRECVVVANDATVKGGTYYPMTVKKHLRAQEVALQNRLPCIYLVDSGGAFLPMQDEVFPDREHFGRIFYNQAQMSRGRHPADRRRARVVHRRRRVRAGDERRGGHRPQPGHDLPRRPAAGEGGDRRGRHRRGAGRRRPARRVSGVTDHLADDDAHALQHRPVDRRHARRRAAPPAVGRRPDRRARRRPGRALRRRADRPAHALRRPRGDRPARRRQRFAEFKPQYGHDAGHRLRPHPRPPGRASSPTTASCSPSRRSRARTSSSCATSAAIPLLFLQNITGFMVGRDYEAGGIAKHGAKMVTAVACARVPKLTVVIGGSFGAGNYSMCGRAYSPRFLLTVAQRADLGDGRRAGRDRAGRRSAATGRGRGGVAAEEEAFKAPIREQYETAGPPVLRHGPAVGRRRDRPRRHPHRARPGPVASPRTPRSADVRLRRLPDVRTADDPAHDVRDRAGRQPRRDRASG